MKDAEEPGHDQHPKGGYTKGMFSGVHTPDDFADTIGVPRKAIRLVRPQNDRCKSRGCLFNAISNNGGHCPAHQRSWYPLSNGRGGNLHGPDFLRPQTNGHRACDCDQKACFSAGYFPSREGAIHIPAAGLETVRSTPNLLSSEAKEKPSLCLYPWHFFKEHREIKDGTWKLCYQKGKSIMTWKEIKHTTFLLPETRHDLILKPSTTRTLDHRINGPMITQM